MLIFQEESTSSFSDEDDTQNYEEMRGSESFTNQSEDIINNGTLQFRVDSDDIISVECETPASFSSDSTLAANNTNKSGGKKWPNYYFSKVQKR